MGMLITLKYWRSLLGMLTGTRPDTVQVAAIVTSSTDCGEIGSDLVIRQNKHLILHYLFTI